MLAILQFNFKRRNAEQHSAGDWRLGQADRRTLSALLSPGRLFVAGQPTDKDAH